MPRRLVLAAAVPALLVAALLPAVASPVRAAAPAAVAYDLTGTYAPLLRAFRVVDTRQAGGAMSARSTRTVSITPEAGLPADGISAVVVNLTVVSPTSSGYLTAWPGGTRPVTSSLNFTAGWTGANMVTVQSAADGSFQIYNSAGRTHVIVDLLGYYFSGGTSDVPYWGSYHSMRPVRVYDSRATTAVRAKEFFNLEFDFGADNGRVVGLAVNVTVVAPTRSGYLSLYNGWSSGPLSSTLNFTPGATVANMALVNAGLNYTTGWTTLGVYNGSGGSVHVVVDVVGVFTNLDLGGLRFEPVSPHRFIDTRIGIGSAKRPLASGESRMMAAPAAGWGDGAVAIATNVTTVKPTRSTYLTLWSGSASRPGVSNANVGAGRVIASSALIPLGPTGGFAVYNHAGAADIVVDAQGVFRSLPADPPYVEIPIVAVHSTRG